MSGSLNIDVKDYEGQVKPSSVEKAAYEENLYAMRICEIPSNMQFRADYDSKTDQQPKYVGNAPKGLAEGTNGWLLKEFTYDANTPRQCTKILVAYGNWTGRTTASYS